MRHRSWRLQSRHRSDLVGFETWRAARRCHRVGGRGESDSVTHSERQTLGKPSSDRNGIAFVKSFQGSGSQGGWRRDQLRQVDRMCAVHQDAEDAARRRCERWALNGFRDAARVINLCDAARDLRESRMADQEL